MQTSAATGRGSWPGREAGAPTEPGAGGRPPLPTVVPTLALLLLELFAWSFFFLELLNFALPESVSFNFSNSLLMGRSMIKSVFQMPCLNQRFTTGFV
jgi:hypothetical protein